MNTLINLGRLSALILGVVLQQFAGNACATSFVDMLARHEVRLAVEYDRTLYYSNHGAPYGLAVELASDLSAWLTQRHAAQLGHRPLNVRIVAMPQGEILAALTNNKADIALGQMRFDRPVADYSALFIQPSAILRKDVLVTGPKARNVATTDQLAGMEIHAAFGSHLASTVARLNQKFESSGLGPIRLTTLPHELLDEDLLQMTNAGLIEAVIVPDWKAQLWTRTLPNIKVHTDIDFQAEGLFGWAVLQSNTDLANELEAFVKNLIETDGMKKFRIDSFLANTRTLKNPVGPLEWSRFERLKALFQRYGTQYHLDPLMMAALGFQETTLDQQARGGGGSIGVMQLMPATGHAMHVGDITDVEANIHAAAKYMDELLRDNFPQANFTGINRTLFAIASYNAGPWAIASIRSKASAEGFDPDVWLGNVEIVAAKYLGVSVMTYVRNVYKYFVTYQLRLQPQLH